MLFSSNIHASFAYAYEDSACDSFKWQWDYVNPTEGQNYLHTLLYFTVNSGGGYPTRNITRLLKQITTLTLKNNLEFPGTSADPILFRHR